MKNIKRVCSSVLCLLLCTVILLLAGCGEQRAAKQAYSKPQELNKLETTCVTENSRYSLIWDAQRQCVILYD
mgnify:CR=1 FL=1